MANSFLIRFAKKVRHRLRRLPAAWRYGSALLEAPISLANGFPKSGTHLLTQILAGLPQVGRAVDSGLPALVMFDGPSGRPRAAEDLRADLAWLRPGDVVYGHLHADPIATDFFCRRGAAAYFIYRDLRDVVVSHAHYVTETGHAHVHRAYYQGLPDFEARLRTSILGLPELEAPFPDIGRRFAPYLGWLGRPEVCALRYEELLGERDAALARVLDFAVGRGFVLEMPREEAESALAARIDPGRSPTFRSGVAGAWRQKFSEANKELFKEVAGHLLIELGYEDSNDW
jgi:hypothetical protein